MGASLSGLREAQGVSHAGNTADDSSKKKETKKMEYLIVLAVALMMGAYTLIIRNCLKDA